ncbi:MAG TPA: cobaltochelatase subunit CobN, partial [Chloroflexota bacterium]
MQPSNRRARNLVTRADGKLVNVARKTGHIFVCADGCCCGDTRFGAFAVPRELFHSEWERRKLRNKVHLTVGGCLGPCVLANVVMLLFDSRSLWFHSFHTEDQVRALYDYIEAMLAAQAYLPPPPALADSYFSAFDWETRSSEQHLSDQAGRLTPEQAGFLFLTQADTDLLSLARVHGRLDTDFPPVRSHNLSSLRSDEDVDAFLSSVLPGAEIIIVRLLGGARSLDRGLERLAQHAAEHDQWLICLPGTDSLDPELIAYSNVGAPVAHEALAYLQFGGLDNYEHLLRFLSDHLLMTGYGFDAPQPQPRQGIYHPDVPEGTPEAWRARANPDLPTLGVLFYRAHWLAGNTDFVDAIVQAGEAAGANVIPVYAYSLKELADDAEWPTALSYFVENSNPNIDVLISTMSFALGSTESDGRGWSADVLRRLDVPIIQAITASSSFTQWADSVRGLGPLDTAINVAIPELDGRIISVPISFKEEGANSAGPYYAPQPDRIERLVGQALRLATLRHKPNSTKRIAFVLTNYASKASRVGNAVGLDSPVSLLRILSAMQDAGYDVGKPPPNGDTLLREVLARGSYDREIPDQAFLADPVASVSGARYQRWFDELPEKTRSQIEKQWGAPPGRYYVDERGDLALAGLELGNAFVALQ